MTQTADLCPICTEPMVAGQPALFDITEGECHAACLGPEREGYVDLDTGEPIGPDDPLPTPHAYAPLALSNNQPERNEP